jgi:glycosyltransferase involved in cell wall biosynthesis
MACEVPVISSNAGGLPELNLHGFSGYLSNIGDVDSMTKFALEILDDKNLPTFKKNALERAKVFELSKILPEYESYYEEVIEKRSSFVMP